MVVQARRNCRSTPGDSVPGARVGNSPGLGITLNSNSTKDDSAVHMNTDGKNDLTGIATLLDVDFDC